MIARGEILSLFPLDSNIDLDIDICIVIVTHTIGSTPTMSFGRPGGFGDNFKVSPPARGSFPLDHDGMFIHTTPYSHLLQSILCIGIVWCSSECDDGEDCID